MHQALGLIDVSTLGKLLVKGPERALPRPALPEPLLRSQGRAHPLRRLTTDAGRIMDDGTVARLDDDTFYVTTTSTGADGVDEWFDVVERRLAHGRRARQPHRRGRRGQRRRPERARADGARVERRLLERGPRVPRRETSTSPACRPGAAHRLRRRARLRAPFPEPARRAPVGHAARRAPTSAPVRSASRHSESSGSRRATYRRPGHRLGVELLEATCRGSRGSTRTSSSASGRSSTSQSAGRRAARRLRDGRTARAARGRPVVVDGSRPVA